ncbi:5487_t:CDS:1, partial [Cetraspora pellucida]
EIENEDKAPIIEDLSEIIDVIILNLEVKIILKIEANLMNGTTIHQIIKK